MFTAYSCHAVALTNYVIVAELLNSSLSLEVTTRFALVRDMTEEMSRELLNFMVSFRPLLFNLEPLPLGVLLLLFSSFFASFGYVR